MGRRRHVVTKDEVRAALKHLNYSKFDTWQDKVRALHALDPKKFTGSALARYFRRNDGTVWWAINHDLYLEDRRARYQEQKERCNARDKARYLRLKNDPAFKARRAAANRRARARARNNAKLRSTGDFVFGVEVRA